MWVSQKNKWNSKATKFERFFVEKIIQKCDFDESISKRHKTTNGYVQVKEMLKLIELSELRSKSVKSLIVLGEESKAAYFKQNVCNDFIIDIYFNDLKSFIQKFDFNSLVVSGVSNTTKLNEFKHAINLFNIQLDKYYLENLLKEFNNLEFDLEHFDTSAKLLDKLIEIYVTYLIFKGYSSSTITNYLTNQLTKGKHITFANFTRVFNFNPRKFKHYLAINNFSDDINDFAELLKVDYKVEVKIPSLLPYVDEQIGNKPYLYFENTSLDSDSHVRSLYDRLLKRLVIKRDRQSLNSFNSFFDLSYWSFSDREKLFKNELNGDPINVSKRERTLIKTLKKLGIVNHVQKEELPNINNEKLENAIYYYNLALGSKSIENSLALLWTSLESSLPYRTANSDVVCVRNIISKLLALGCISRDVMALSTRFVISNKLNRNLLTGPDITIMDIPTNNKRLIEWYNWLKENKSTRFQKIVDTSDYLAFEYSRFGQFISNGTSKELLNRIEGSKYSLDYQIQRIYIHRNQIIHAGDFINEYTNLWMNIEWYTGKLLAFMIKAQLDGKCIKNAVQEMESDYDYLISYLDKNRNKKIEDLPDRITKIYLNQFWQSF